MPAVDKCTESFMNLLKKQDLNSVNIYSMYQQYTLDVIAQVALGETQCLQVFLFKKIKKIK